MSRRQARAKATVAPATEHAAAVARVFEWFRGPSPADPDRLVKAMAEVFHPTAHTLDGLGALAVVKDADGAVMELDADGNIWQTGNPNPVDPDAVAYPIQILCKGVAA